VCCVLGNVSRTEYMDICKAAWVKRMVEFAQKEEIHKDVLGYLFSCGLFCEGYCWMIKLMCFFCSVCFVVVVVG
jgi:hypothetical protein